MDIDKTLKEMGFRIISTLSVDTYDGCKGTHTHKVVVSKGDLGFTVKYTSGCYNRTHPDTGGRPIQSGLGKLNDGELLYNKETIPDAPVLASVIYSMVNDSECVRFGQSFEDFCNELGYNDDSITDERIYKQCVKNWKNMVYIGSDFEALEILFEDY